MGPVRQNPIQRPVSLFMCVCIALCTIVAHNNAQNRPDNFPPYPPDRHPSVLHTGPHGQVKYVENDCKKNELDEWLSSAQSDVSSA